MLKRFLTFFLFVLIFSGVPRPVFANEPNVYKPEASLGSFKIPPGLEGYVDFWKKIFGVYGKYELVFHHRDYPSIVYSVLDFRERAKILNPVQIDNLMFREEKAETTRIRNALVHLGHGRAPRNQLERKIVKDFSANGLTLSRHFRVATEARQIRSQKGMREKFAEGLSRSGRYIEAIEHIFQSEGLPIELSKLPHVESSFDYQAYSSVGAAGVWQFMRSTGKRYMRIDASIDERRDAIIASRAAAKYLAHAYSKLNSWPLAITSYNHGISGVMRGVKETGSRDIVALIKRYKGKTWGFASKNFYAEFLAAVIVDREKKVYFPGLVMQEPWHFEEVRLGRATNFSKLIEASGVGVDAIKKYNTALLDPVLKGRVAVPAGFLFKVPAGQGNLLVARLGHGSVLSLDGASETFVASMQERRSQESLGGRYRVKSGDTIGSIARVHGLSNELLMQENNLSDPRKLRAGQLLKVPQRTVSKPKAAKPSIVVAQSSDRKTYRVEKGDSLSLVAKKTGNSVKRLRELNSLSSDKIYAGQSLFLE